jgi:uncharacterized membrane protein YphA (DoxX/SURF4 family)
MAIESLLPAIPGLTQEIAVWILRGLLIIIFLFGGIMKLMKFNNTLKMMNGTMFKPAKFWAIVLPVAEILGALALIFGIYLREGVYLLILVMLGAAYSNWFTWKKGFMGAQLDLTIIASLLVLLFLI